jgi:transforming growth factor-beta-induced protein
VWAPTNEAFAAIGPETLNFILSDASLLKDILTYHLGLFLQPYTLVPAIKDELTLPTVQGEVTRINVYRKKGSSFVSERVNIFKRGNNFHLAQFKEYLNIL